MKENKTCDCTLSDYANTKMEFAREGVLYNKYSRCLPYGKPYNRMYFKNVVEATSQQFLSFLR